MQFLTPRAQCAQRGLEQTTIVRLAWTATQVSFRRPTRKKRVTSVAMDTPRTSLVLLSVLRVSLGGTPLLIRATASSAPTVSSKS